MQAIYVRISTGRGQDMRSQVADLKRWAASQEVDIAWYKDTASGKTMERPAMVRLMADIGAGKITRVVVWRLDRLGRTAAGLTKLFDDLVSRKIGLYSLRDNLDLETPSGRLMACVLASVAAYETEVRRERQLAGIAAAKAEGKTWGGRKPGTRVRLTKEKERTIKRMHAAGEPIAAIARTVELSRPTIYAALA